MNNKTTKPFLKWAGGKTQLINDIEKALPKDITNDKFTYIEPFVGSGAVLFWMLNNFPKLKKAVINDINEATSTILILGVPLKKDSINKTKRVLTNELNKIEIRTTTR